MICGTASCGCAIISDSLQVTGSGGPGNPYHLETNAFTVCTSTTRPSPPFTNQFIYETDTGLSYRYSGTGWEIFAWTRLPVCQIRMSSPQSIANGSAATVLSFDTEDLDVFGWHAGGSPTRITPTIAGWYRMTVNLSFGNDTDYTGTAVAIYKNAAPPVPEPRAVMETYNGVPSLSVTSNLISMNGTTDYFTVVAAQTNTSAGANTITASFTARWEANP